MTGICVRAQSQQTSDRPAVPAVCPCARVVWRTNECVFVWKHRLGWGESELNMFLLNHITAKKPEPLLWHTHTRPHTWRPSDNHLRQLFSLCVFLFFLSLSLSLSLSRSLSLSLPLSLSVSLTLTVRAHTVYCTKPVGGARGPGTRAKQQGAACFLNVM